MTTGTEATDTPEVVHVTVAVDTPPGWRRPRAPITKAGVRADKRIKKVEAAITQQEGMARMAKDIAAELRRELRRLRALPR